MGISVISPSPSASPAIAGVASPSALQPLAEGSQPVDFAALLINQISGLQQSITAFPEATSAPGKTGDEGLTEIIKDLLNPHDPALDPQIALAYSAPLPADILPIAIPKDDASLLPGLSLLPLNEKYREKAAQTGKDGLTDPLLAGLKAIGPQASGIPVAATQADVPAVLAVPSREAAILAGESSSTAPQTFAATLSSQTSVTSQATTAPNLPAVATPLQDSRWPQDFGDRIVWMAKNDQLQAQINITPPQMGPIQITLSMNGDQASIAFASPHAEVRKAIEDALPNLREMLSTSGINLGQSDVGAEMKQQQREMAGQFANGQRFAGETAILPADSHLGSNQSGRPIQQGRGLVDLFA